MIKLTPQNNIIILIKLFSQAKSQTLLPNLMTSIFNNKKSGPFSFSSTTNIILNPPSLPITLSPDSIEPPPPKRIKFKVDELPIETPIPAFNSDNKQKLARDKLNRPLRGILRRNKKYLVPKDILTEQVRRNEARKEHLFEEIIDFEEQKENNDEIFSFFSNTGNTFFRKSNFNYSRKLQEENIGNNEKSDNEENPVKVSKKNVFNSVVNDILVDNPFSKLQSKEEEVRKIGENSNKLPFYQRKDEKNEEKFSIPILPESIRRKKEEIEKTEPITLFNYEKAGKSKKEMQWEFKEKPPTKKKPEVVQEAPTQVISQHEIKENFDSPKIAQQIKTKPEMKKEEVEKPKTERTFKLKESKSEQILKEWPSSVSYNFGLNISKDASRHEKIKSDLNNISTIILNATFDLKESKEIEDRSMIISYVNMRYFLKEYAFAQSNGVIINIIGRTIMKHTLSNSTYQLSKLEEFSKEDKNDYNDNKYQFRTELYSFCYFSNDSVLVTGGIDPVHGEILNETLCFNFENKNITFLQPLNHHRYNHLMFFYKEMVFCIGGNGGQDKSIKSCEKFENDEWIGIASLKMKRNFIRGNLSEKNKCIYVYGTNNEEEKQIIFIFEKYDIESDKWSAIHLKNELILTNQFRSLLLSRHSVFNNNKIYDDIIYFDNENNENFTYVFDSEQEMILKNQEITIDFDRFLVGFEDSLFIFRNHSFEEADRIFFHSALVDNIKFSLL